MELDHIFIFTQKAEEVARALQAYGLSEGSANVHPGQGTACRRFYFENAYLELAWVIDEKEIKNPLIKRTNLWERSRYELTRYCPFGLCFRSEQSAGDPIRLLFEDGWRYHSAFLPQGQYANIASNEDFPAEPMLFEMPFFGLTPTDYPLDKQQPLTHARGYRQLTNVSLTLPAPVTALSPPMQQVLYKSKVHLSWGDTYRVGLEFDDGHREECKDFTGLLPLMIHG